MNYTAVLHQDDVEMVGFFQENKPKNGYGPSLDRVRTINCQPGFLEQYTVNLESHRSGWVIEQMDYPLYMKG